MEITERQEKILDCLIRQYIATAKPVGSEFLVEKNDFSLCPATIRNEMQKLAEDGYLCQPHPSAGRIPTSKAYRFFADKTLELDFDGDSSFWDFEDMEKEKNDIYKFSGFIARELAENTSSLALAYLFNDDFLWKDGWKEVFQNPEFKEENYLEEFVDAIDCFEKNIKNFFDDQKEKQNEVSVFIGEEGSILNSSDFGLIISMANFPKNKKGLVAILGPKRMAYDKNIKTMYYLINELNQI
jgi:transcriptional regulator of heat shock response